MFLALFHGFVFRLGSFLQLQADLAQPQLQHCTEAPRAFGDDVLRYSLSSFALAPLKQVLVNINRRLKRNKALDPGRVRGRVVAALEGIEVLSSFSRRCGVLSATAGRFPERTRAARRADPVLPGSTLRSSTGVLQAPCESPRQVCNKASPTKVRAFRRPGNRHARFLGPGVLGKATQANKCIIASAQESKMGVPAATSLESSTDPDPMAKKTIDQ